MEENIDEIQNLKKQIQELTNIYTKEKCKLQEKMNY